MKEFIDEFRKELAAGEFSVAATSPWDDGMAEAATRALRYLSKEVAAKLSDGQLKKLVCGGIPLSDLVSALGSTLGLDEE